MLLLMIFSMLAAGPVEVLAPDKDNSAKSCNADKSWCVTLLEGEDDVPALLVDDGGVQQNIPLPGLPEEGGFDHSFDNLWSSRIPLAGAGGSLFGVVREHKTMYSGGGGHAGRLTLYRTSRDTKAVTVLTVPWDSGLLIRACFNDRDIRQRRGVCHDEYEYTAKFEVMASGVGDMPDLRYTAEATSFPGKVSRSEDSLAGPRLKKKDIVHARNEECSFTRTFSFDMQSKQYVPDEPLPECGDYTDF